jgi:hypothetical protein
MGQLRELTRVTSLSNQIEMNFSETIDSTSQEFKETIIDFSRCVISYGNKELATSCFSSVQCHCTYGCALFLVSVINVSLAERI